MKRNPLLTKYLAILSVSEENRYVTLIEIKTCNTTCVILFNLSFDYFVSDKLEKNVAVSIPFNQFCDSRRIGPRDWISWSSGRIFIFTSRRRCTIATSRDVISAGKRIARSNLKFPFFISISTTHIIILFAMSLIQTLIIQNVRNNIKHYNKRGISKFYYTKN